MKDQTEQEPSDPAGDMSDTRPDRSVEHERQGGGKHEEVQLPSMMERVLDGENMDRAWKRVRANHGAPGIDGMTVEQFPAFFCESEFSDRSYGFGEDRNAHQAVREMEACWKERRRHAVDCDFKSFFDTVNHDRLQRISSISFPGIPAEAEHQGVGPVPCGVRASPGAT